MQNDFIYVKNENRQSIKYIWGLETWDKALKKFMKGLKIRFRTEDGSFRKISYYLFNIL